MTTAIGSEGSERIEHPSPGNDSIYGNGGDDTIVAGAGNDYIDGGSDGVFGDTYDAYDAITRVQVDLSAGRATVYGGVDTLVGMEHVVSGSGDDILVGSDGTNWFTPGGGNDYIDGRGGYDAVMYEAPFGGINANLQTGVVTGTQAGNDTLVGIENLHATWQNDTIVGSDDSNYFFDRAGDDSVNGGGGDDTFNAGSGNDTFDGGDGWDTLSFSSSLSYDGGPSPSQGVVINGDTGAVTDAWGNTDQAYNIEGYVGSSLADRFTASSGDVSWIGLAGNDTVIGPLGQLTLDYSMEVAFGGTRGIVANMAAGTVVDTFGDTDSISGITDIRGTQFNDSITGGLDNDWEGFAGYAGDDTLVGGSGYDEALYHFDHRRGATQGIVLNLATGTAIDGWGNTDTLVSIEAVRGSMFADSITGSDTTARGVWDDFERFRGLAGNDTIDGNGGIDEVDYSTDARYGGTGAINVNLATGVAIDGFGDTDTLRNVHRIRGTAGNDIVIGSDNVGQKERVRLLAGNDTFHGAGGYDEIDYGGDAGAGGNGGVVVDLGAGTATDGFGDTDTFSGVEAVVGTRYADRLTGSGNYGITSGWERFRPGAGNDTIDGGAGMDCVDYYWTGGTRGLEANLATGTIVDAFGHTDTVSNVEVVYGTAFADRFTGTSQTSTLGDRTTYEIFEGMDGNDTIDGQGGIDIVSYAMMSDLAPTAGASVNLATGTATDLLGGTDTLISIEGVIGSMGADTIIGSDASNVFFLQGGNDTVDGGAGLDVVRYDGARADYSITRSNGSVIVSHRNGGADGTDTLTSIETLVFSDGQVSLSRNASDIDGDGRGDLVWHNASTGAVYAWAMNGAQRLEGNLLGSVGTTWRVAAIGDLNGDGKADIVWRDTTTGGTYMWLLDGTSRYTGTAGPTLSTDYALAGSGDFDGDGKGDILWRNASTGATYVWTMDGARQTGGGLIGSLGATVSIAAVEDFDGDGKADILLRDSATGANTLWFMNGASLGSVAAAPSVSTGYAIVGSGDFNGDGKADIAWRNTSNGAVYVWTMDGARQVSGSLVGSADTSLRPARIGDFNGDGKADILWRNTSTGENFLWLMDGGQRLAAAATPSVGTAYTTGPATSEGGTQQPPRPTAAFDFDGDGKSDMLWRNTSTGSLTVWTMNGASRIAGATVGTLGTDWRAAGVEDFDGDGKADVLLRNQSTGATYIWFMNGTTRTAGANLGTVTGYSVAGTGDATGDGKADILWHNASNGAVVLWTMDGGRRTGGLTLGTVTGTWSVSSMADIDGNGTADILWRNTATGANQVWFMGANGRTGGSAISPVGTSYSLAGAADFNGDGKADLLWRDATSGAVYLWTMDGATRTAGISLGTVSAEWAVASVGDHNGDGKADLLWRDESTGRNMLWTMDGGRRTGGAYMPTTGSDWRTAGLLAG